MGEVLVTLNSLYQELIAQPYRSLLQAEARVARLGISPAGHILVETAEVVSAELIPGGQAGRDWITAPEVEAEESSPELRALEGFTAAAAVAAVAELPALAQQA